MDIKAAIKEHVKHVGMDLCGIASIDRFAESPKGKHPTEILPGCKSVIVVGIGLLDGVIQANFRAFEEGRNDLKGLYGTYGYAMLPNFELTYACYSTAKFIERNFGEVATPLSTGPQTNGAQMSIRHAAVAAGLGEFGWLSIVLTPEFGPRNRFGIILTTLEIEPDPMYDGPKLCDPEKCHICVDVCPTHAIGAYGTDECRTCTLGDKTYTYGKVSFPRCQLPTQGLRKEYGGMDDYCDTNDPTSKDIAEAGKKKPLIDMGLQHTDTWHCGKCLSYCPAGNWAKHYLDRNLSSGK